MLLNYFRCYYHAHVCGFNRSMTCKDDTENEARRRKVEETNLYIRGLGYNLIHIRECEWRARKILEGLQSRCLEMHKSFFPDTR